MNQLESWMTSEAFSIRRPQNSNRRKIKEGVEVLYGLHKTRGGLIRTAEEVSQGRIEDITISGDFTFYPKEQLTGLEESLQKAPLKKEKIIERVENFYEDKKVESPGVESKDFAQTILSLLRNRLHSANQRISPNPSLSKRMNSRSESSRRLRRGGDPADRMRQARRLPYVSLIITPVLYQPFRVYFPTIATRRTMEASPPS